MRGYVCMDLSKFQLLWEYVIELCVCQCRCNDDDDEGEGGGDSSSSDEK